jgi:hypothetical protein
MADHWYYLHKETKDLIFKKLCPENDSPFVERIWSIDIKARRDAWIVVLEALALDAKLERIKELADHWNMTLEDSFAMLKQLEVTEERKVGLVRFIERILNMTNDEYWSLVYTKERNG